jgi:aspartate/methionine/tyrosine aminotransferase
MALLDECGVAVTPGPYFGAGGTGHVRVALVPTIDDCARAAERISRWRAAPR